MFRLCVAGLATLYCCLGLATAGCAVVRPHERQNLSRRTMTEDRAPGQTRFVQHQTGSREGADGGTGEPGGGCGCN